MLGMMRYDATKTLAAISVPTLVVAGDRDSTTKPEASERICASVPGARLITLTPAKHLGLIEHHTRYAEVVGEFALCTPGALTEGFASGLPRTKLRP
jgi:pimeloyl-ACP methyl ester carboxylesterase